MTLDRRIRVLLADDHAMVRESLARVLEDSGRVTIVGQARDGDEAVHMAEQMSVDVAVLDYSMPGRDAPRVIERLSRHHPQTRSLVLTVHENVHYAVKSLESGAGGYLVKSAAVEELVDAIAAVAAGEIYLSPAVAPEVMRHLSRPRRERVGLAALSDREFDMLRLLGAGNSLAECASKLSVSTSTASTYRARLLSKLNLAGTAELIRFAIEHGVVG